MKTLRINHLAVWLLIISFQVLSVLWFSPLLFAGRWMSYLGKTFTDFKGESVLGIFISLLGATFACYSLAWLFVQLRVDTIGKGLRIAVILWLSFFFLETLTQDTFSLRPFGLSLINGGAVFLQFCLAGGVLSSWRKYQTD